MNRIIFKPKMEQCFDTIREEFALVEKQRDEALAKLAAWNKDSEIQKYTEQIDRLREEMSAGFNPTQKQWDAVRKWEETHVHRLHQEPSGTAKVRKYNPGAAIFSYSFSYTHLGCLGTVECETCRRFAIENSGGDYLKYLKLLEGGDCTFSIGEV